MQFGQAVREDRPVSDERGLPGGIPRLPWAVRSHRAPALVYISCNPATQARDAGFLVNRCGYAVKRMAIFDLYPQTHHIETALVLSLDA